MKLTLKTSKKEAKDTMSFHFKSEKEIDFLPGQFIYLTLPKLQYEDSRGNTRLFTIANSPTEKGELMVATRMRPDSGFKNTLKEFKAGSKLMGEGPNGTFILDEKESGEHVILAGGIGITPFRSIIKFHTDNKTSTKLTLIYANSTPEEITFKKDLEKWAKKNGNLDVYFTVSKPGKSWKGLKGRVDEKMIKELAPNTSNKTFWVCGPPTFVDAMESILDVLDLKSSQVKTEKFSGY